MRYDIQGSIFKISKGYDFQSEEMHSPSPSRPRDPAYKIGSQLISRCNKTRDFGIIISEDLNRNSINIFTAWKRKPILADLREHSKCRKYAFMSDVFTTFIHSHSLHSAKNGIRGTNLEPVVPNPNRKGAEQFHSPHSIFIYDDPRSFERRNSCLRITDRQSRSNRRDMVMTWDIINTPDHPCKDLIEFDRIQRTRCHDHKLKKVARGKT